MQRRKPRDKRVAGLVETRHGFIGLPYQMSPRPTESRFIAM